AGFGVGICSSVIPYVCDQMAMARMARATFALLLALLPATAAVIGVVVLRPTPTVIEVIGILLVMKGVAAHKERDHESISILLFHARRFGMHDPKLFNCRSKTRTDSEL